MRQIAAFIFVLFIIQKVDADTMSNEKQFQELQSLNWVESFADSCTGNWQAGWFLDGER